MRKGTDIIGKPVVVFENGRVVDHVKDVIFDHEQNQVIGFLVDEGGWLSSARTISFDQVQAIGSDAVIIASNDRIKRGEEIPVVKQVLDRKPGALRGLKLMTTDGRDLGKMVDIFFDETSGRLEGYEVSGGLFSDAYSGRSFVPAPQTVRLGDEVAFVGPETAELMEEQVGGLKGAAERAREGVQSAAARAREGVEDATDRAREGVQGATIRVREGVQDATERWGAKATLDSAHGRRLQTTVMTRDLRIVGAAGQVVTEPVIERARRYGMEEELLESAGLTPAGAASARAQHAAGTAGATLREGAADVRDAVGTAWTRVRRSVGSMKERAMEQREEARIQSSLGLPVTRVILDRDDRVILNTGELITHDAVDRAREAGVLEALLDSAYRSHPEFSKEELRAPEPGEASLSTKLQDDDDRALAAQGERER